MNTRAKVGIGAAFAVGLGAGSVFLTGAHAERCALLSSGAFTGKFYHADGGCPPDPKGKPQFTFLPAPKVSAPEYDPATQVLTGPTYTVGKSEVTTEWNLRDKTTQELADEVATEEDNIMLAINKVVLKALCRLENHDRASDGKATLTLKQCADLVRSLL